MKIKLEHDQGVVTLRAEGAVAGDNAMVLDPGTLEQLADWCGRANEDELQAGDWFAVESEGAGDNVVTCSDDDGEEDEESDE